jgi:hypothetical protein
MKIIPVNFNSEYKAMLEHCKMIFEADGGGTLDKESTSYNYIFDAFRLALRFYHFRDSSSEY